MSLPTTHIDRYLLNRITLGDKDAFAELYYTFERHVYTAALKITRSEAQAEEVVQDVFLQTWLKREQIEQVEDIRSWLFIIARNRSYEFLRRLAYQRKYQLHSAENSPPYTDAGSIENPLQEKQLQELVEEAVCSLPERQREVYRMIREKGMSREEVARALGIEPNTVKASLSRALRTVRAYCVARLDLPSCLVVAAVYKYISPNT